MDESFLAHCAIFKAINYNADKDVLISQRSWLIQQK